jgi:hypothetical protein
MKQKQSLQIVAICPKSEKGAEKKGIFNGIVERRVRGQSKLRAKQQRNNKRFAKLRGLVQVPVAAFAIMNTSYEF